MMTGEIGPDSPEMLHAFLKLVHKPESANMTLRQFTLLMLLNTSLLGVERTVRHLAQLIGVKKPVITRAMLSFEDLNFVTRAKNPDDKRDVFFSITREGIDYLTL